MTSEIAIVPDKEFSDPTLMVLPEVSTHDSALDADSSLAELPHALRTSATADRAAGTRMPYRRRRERVVAGGGVSVGEEPDGNGTDGIGEAFLTTSQVHSGGGTTNTRHVTA
ncbi:hypothetical protein GTC6_14939 [Gordonia terrae C-6]|uniref:Uncharacterized protein n=1 Tax=Gordonia terrae C-6 TaxID=1316928 RepID=R7Y7B2_9ACTN|nr:hypothetical protein GTC6_14939 [Gordonia terrae C-6]